MRRCSEDVEAREASALRGRPSLDEGRGLYGNSTGRGVAGRCLGRARGLAARPAATVEGFCCILSLLGRLHLPENQARNFVAVRRKPGLWNAVCCLWTFYTHSVAPQSLQICHC